jgi:hypothetical protein
MSKSKEDVIASMFQTLMEQARQAKQAKQEKQPKLFKVQKSTPKERRFLMLKVVLKGISPPIWRSFVLPNDLTFADLHEVLQVIMGWEDCHLYEFTVGKRPHARTLSIVDEEMISPFGEDTDDVADFDLSFFSRKGMKFTYTYDFGDSWEHEITVEDSNYDYSGDQLVFVLSGKRNCPPEDCGGVLGYYNILEALNDPHGDSEILEWIGNNYDPEKFSLDKYNRVLAKRFGKLQKSPCKKCTKKNVKKEK